VRVQLAAMLGKYFQSHACVVLEAANKPEAVMATISGIPGVRNVISRPLSFLA
jgi:hypothetical protein